MPNNVTTKLNHCLLTVMSIINQLPPAIQWIWCVLLCPIQEKDDLQDLTFQWERSWPSPQWCSSALNHAEKQITPIYSSPLAKTSGNTWSCFLQSDCYSYCTTNISHFQSGWAVCAAHKTYAATRAHQLSPENSQQTQGTKKSWQEQQRAPLPPLTWIDCWSDHTALTKHLLIP